MKINFFLFITLFLASLLWLIIVPLWHFPDEQAHFGQVVYFAEKGRNPQGEELDLTEEIYTSEQLLGTARDKFGNNKFTFHPEYRIEYTDSLVGKYEASIAALAKTEAKKKFVHQEASRYPKLYYIPASWLYKLFYAQDLFTRVFAVRFWSLFLFLGTVYMTYRMGKLLFPEDNLSSLTLPILVGFQPMMVFANVGVNSDALGNFLFTLFLYLSLILIIRGLKIKPLVFLVLTIIFCLYTKPQFIVTIPLLALTCLFIIWRDFLKEKKSLLVAVILPGIIILSYCLYRLGIGSFSLISRFLNNLNFQSLIKFTWEYTLPHTYKEVMPWYWGIYDWLGVTYPRVVHRIINRLVLLAGVGFIIWIIKIVKKDAWKERKVQGIFFLLFSQLVFFLGISFYDWLSWYTQKYPLGVQGRYFFPLISVQMLILLLGWSSLFPERRHLKEWGVRILGILMVILNFYGLYTIAKTYYTLWPISTFITQISQYKPWFLKGSWFVALWFIYVMTMVTFLVEYIQRSHEKKN